MCLVAGGVDNADGVKPFQLLFANFGWATVALSLPPAITKAAAQPVNLMEAHTSNGDTVGLILDEPSDGKFCKRNIDRKNINTINRYFSNQLETHTSANEKPRLAN